MKSRLKHWISSVIVIAFPLCFQAQEFIPTYKTVELPPHNRDISGFIDDLYSSGFSLIPTDTIQSIAATHIHYQVAFLGTPVYSARLIEHKFDDHTSLTYADLTASSFERESIFNVQKTTVKLGPFISKELKTEYQTISPDGTLVETTRNNSGGRLEAFKRRNTGWMKIYLMF